MTAVRTVRSPCGIGTNMTTTNTITVEMRIKVIDLILDYMPTAYSSGSVGENSKYKYEKYKYSQRVAQAVFALCVEQKKHRKYKY